jgi:DNA-binding phage protein
MRAGTIVRVWMFRRLDEWIADQDEEMSRPEAIRRLLDAALEAGEVEATLLHQVRALARDLAREKGGK